MRILVGTLYTIENEFDECVDAIRRQSHSDFEHFVIEGLPKQQAHERLYGTFMNRAHEFDLLMKVDADMVIEDRDLFAKIAQHFEQQKDLDMLTIGVMDFFTGQIIAGLHTYSHRVRWNLGRESLFTDLNETYNGRRESDYERLAPAAIHCKNPSALQCFHYGIHRAMKVIQPGKKKLHQSQNRNRWSDLARVQKRFHDSGDKRLALALLGAELTFAGQLSPKCLDYGSPKLLSESAHYAALDRSELINILVHFQRINWGFLPDRLRRLLITIQRSGCPAGRTANIVVDFFRSSRDRFVNRRREMGWRRLVPWTIQWLNAKIHCVR